MAFIYVSASSCRYHMQGACIFAEMRNPGLDKSRVCLRLDKLCGDFDAFVDRAEKFGLGEGQAAKIWDARRHEALKAGFPCPHPAPQEIGQGLLGELDCRYLFRLACLLRLPPCTGFCDNYLSVI
ncbi:hypothetical protein LJC15_05335 [Desulfovibrio sp. OttesenSCG-928-G11]|nr:hypothetical protein [Desulfovibrio sp. OttesenSCG-928-G11]